MGEARADGQPTKLVKSLFGVPSDRGGFSWLEECPDYIKKPANNADHALLARYKETRSGFSKSGLNLTSVHIYSPELKEVVRRVFRRYPGQTVDEEIPSFDTPFWPFLHQWAALHSVQAQLEPKNKELASQVGALISTVNEELSETIQDTSNLIQNGNILFHLLWTLFPPGCPVISDLDGKPHAFLVNESKYLGGEVEPSFALDLLLLDCDGSKYGWLKTSRVIKPFSGSTRIQALPVVPVQFHDDASAMFDALAARGTSAVELWRTSPVYKSYEGYVRLHNNSLMDDEDIFVEGRIIIDPKGHSQHANRYSPSVYTIPHRLESFLTRDRHTKLFKKEENPENEILTVMESLNKHPILKLGSTKLKPMPGTRLDEKSPLYRHRWTEALFGLPSEAFCRSVIRGYCLSSKSWAQFEVDCVSEIRWNENAFDALVMPAPRKRLLEALVKQQQTHKSDADIDDFVKGKGQGLIMLLTGPPGTGKTLTAESIADRLRLPLYAVSAGELGNSAKDIEHRFGHILRLAASWNALLLLDEADAFLDKRIDTFEARERNKMVAAFLRILEYYKGILILTTNRIVNFDDAFYSRIHLTLPFKNLDEESRAGIWKNFLRGAEVNNSELSKLASRNLNGRQIKNIMKMARLLAKDNNEPIGAKHICDVLDVMEDDEQLYRGL